LKRYLSGRSYWVNSNEKHSKFTIVLCTFIKACIRLTSVTLVVRIAAPDLITRHVLLSLSHQDTRKNEINRSKSFGNKNNRIL
jgi:hypothetical protein